MAIFQAGLWGTFQQIKWVIEHACLSMCILLFSFFFYTHTAHVLHFCGDIICDKKLKTRDLDLHYWQLLNAACRCCNECSCKARKMSWNTLWFYLDVIKVSKQTWSCKKSAHIMLKCFKLTFISTAMNTFKPKRKKMDFTILLMSFSASNSHKYCSRCDHNDKDPANRRRHHSFMDVRFWTLLLVFYRNSRSSLHICVGIMQGCCCVVLCSTVLKAQKVKWPLHLHRNRSFDGKQARYGSGEITNEG